MVQVSIFASAVAVGVSLFGSIALTGCGSGISDAANEVDGLEVARRNEACETKQPWRMRTERRCVDDDFVDGNPDTTDHVNSDMEPYDTLADAKDVCENRGDNCLGVEANLRKFARKKDQVIKFWSDREGDWRLVMKGRNLKPCVTDEDFEVHFKKNLDKKIRNDDDSNDFTQIWHANKWQTISDYTCTSDILNSKADPFCGTGWSDLTAAKIGCDDNEHCVGIEQTETLDENKNVVSVTFQCLRVVEAEPVCKPTCARHPKSHSKNKANCIDTETRHTIYVDAEDGF